MEDVAGSLSLRPNRNVSIAHSCRSLDLYMYNGPENTVRPRRNSRDQAQLISHYLGGNDNQFREVFDHTAENGVGELNELVVLGIRDPAIFQLQSEARTVFHPHCRARSCTVGGNAPAGCQHEVLAGACRGLSSRRRLPCSASCVALAACITSSWLSGEL